MADLTPDRITQLLGLVPLEPEGGRVAQTWHDGRSSAIYYLMAVPEASGLHRLDHLEIWAWHAGSPARMLLVSPDGELTEPVLGPDLEAGERPQVIVPAGWWQAAEPLGAWTLVSTFMAPPYSDDAVTFNGGAALADAYPDHADRIRRLARF
ncbi:MAG: cupin domain-containing protein [Chloroflexota bacterium]